MCFELNGFGIGSYVQFVVCCLIGVFVKFSFLDIFGEIMQVVDIFYVSFLKLIVQQKVELVMVIKNMKGLSVFWYFLGIDILYVGVGIGVFEFVMQMVGLKNVVGDVKQIWIFFGWEFIVVDDFDVIILIDVSWNMVVSKIQLFESNFVIVNFIVVKDYCYIMILFLVSEVGVRIVDVVVLIQKQLKVFDIL